MSLNTFLFQESCFIFLKYFEHSVLCPCNVYLHAVSTESKIANTVLITMLHPIVYTLLTITRKVKINYTFICILKENNY